MRNGLIILGEMQDQDLIWLARNGTVVRHPAGHVLIEAGLPVDHFYVTMDGHVEVSHEVRGTIAELGVGEVIGEMSLVEDRVPNTTVTCRDDCRFLAVPRDVLEDHLANDSSFAVRFYHAMAVFLSDRLRTQSSGGTDDELGEAMLDNLHVAGDRMVRLMALLEGRET